LESIQHPSRLKPQKEEKNNEGFKGKSKKKIPGTQEPDKINCIEA
jgi:hypothetical protein